MPGTDEAPESPEEEHPTLLCSSTEVAQTLGIRPAGLAAPPTAFFANSAADPTDAEAALVALALRYGAKSEEVEWFQTTVLKEELAYNARSTNDWVPPSTGAWKRPTGDLQALVAVQFSSVENACIFAEALARFGAASAPSTGSMTRWWSLLKRGKLEVKLPKRNISRTPFIFMMAARLLRDKDDALRWALRKPAAPRTRLAAAVAAEAMLSPSPSVPREELEMARRQIESLESKQKVS